MSTNPRIPYQLATDRPVLPGPDGKRIIAHVVVNVENWRFDAAMPRRIITAPHGAEAVPDVPNFAWAEYGMRCGMPRILRALGERGLPASTTINAGVIETYPRLAEVMAEAGWEFVGHGLDQRSLQSQGGMSEAEVIATALSILSEFTGEPVRGWLGPGLKESDETPDLLKEAGFDYVADWVLDDLPTWMRTRAGPLVAMPYTLEINDSVLHAVQHQPSDEMHRRLEWTLEAFDRGGQDRTAGGYTGPASAPYRSAAPDRVPRADARPADVARRHRVHDRLRHLLVVHICRTCPVIRIGVVIGGIGVISHAFLAVRARCR